MKFHLARTAYILVFFIVSAFQAKGADQPAKDVRVKVDAKHKIAEFDPRRALGGGLDGHWQGDEMQMLSPSSVEQMLEAGLGPISVRLRTELGVAAWHWNPRGRWSDPAHHQGYWTSDDTPRPDEPILLSYGYKLPRRGDTTDEANDDGYSRLDDGDAATFWKSNPYFAQPFTGEPDSEHPQWVVLDLNQTAPIDAIRIQWAEPYATDFEIEYAAGGAIYAGGHPRGVWKRFPHGKFVDAKGGDALLRVADEPIHAQYLRIWMTRGSGTAPANSSDVRDRLGYAIREIGAGNLDASGKLHDYVLHSPNKSQTLAYVSSTDPWHRATDRDPHIEQPGIDLMYRSKINRGLPIMQAVPVMYDTPENAAALATYLRKSNYSVARFEMGEEPDGQLASPRDYAAVYAGAARAVRKSFPNAVIGGPSFVTGGPAYFDIQYGPWLRAFRDELRRRGQTGDFQFLSFEWYPFSDGGPPENVQILENPSLLEQALARFKPEGLPIIVTESNYSAFSTENEMDLGGGMFNAETAAIILCHGHTEYFYGYEPNKMDEKDHSWGTQLMLLKRKGDSRAVPVSTFHTLRMVTTDWLDPKGGPHEAYSVSTNLQGYQKKLLSAFAVKRPDATWALLLINKDTRHTIRLSLAGISEAAAGRGQLVTYSSAQYQWHSDGPDGHPIRNDPPARSMVDLSSPIVLPPWSISVLQTGRPK